MPVELRIDGLGAPQRLAPGCNVGSLPGYMQSACDGKAGMANATPRETTQLSTLTFQQGGTESYVLRLKSALELELSLEARSDGACAGRGGEAVACDSSVKVLRTFAAPANALFTQRIVTLDASRKETPFSCTH